MTTNTEKLRRALDIMKERRHDTVGLGMPITIIEEVLVDLEEEDEWMKEAKEKLGNASLKLASVTLAGYLYEGKFITDLSELNGVTMNEGNHPVPLYRKEKI